MATVQIHDEGIALDEPVLIEGLPGVGLVGKIAADHLVEAFDMVHYGSLHCDGLPEVAVYHEDSAAVKSPVRVYADEANDLLVLTSDVPVSPSTADGFAGCVTDWLAENDVTPVYLSGLPTEKDGVPSLSGVATGDAESLLSGVDVAAPSDDGAVTGPTGSLLHEAARRGVDAVGLVVEADPKFPDPEAARVLLVDGIGPLAGVDVDTDRLVEQAEDISEAKNQLASQMEEGGEEATSARPLGMYQ